MFKFNGDLKAREQDDVPLGTLAFVFINWEKKVITPWIPTATPTRCKMELTLNPMLWNFVYFDLTCYGYQMTTVHVGYLFLSYLHATIKL